MLVPGLVLAQVLGLDLVRVLGFDLVQVLGSGLVRVLGPVLAVEPEWQELVCCIPESYSRHRWGLQQDDSTMASSGRVGT